MKERLRKERALGATERCEKTHRAVCSRVSRRTCARRQLAPPPFGNGADTSHGALERGSTTSSASSRRRCTRHRAPRRPACPQPRRPGSHLSFTKRTEIGGAPTVARSAAADRPRSRAWRVEPARVVTRRHVPGPAIPVDRIGGPHRDAEARQLGGEPRELLRVKNRASTAPFGRPARRQRRFVPRPAHASRPSRRRSADARLPPGSLS